eukprot:134859-Chlamydomonas_euryale.AAC.1
MSEHLCSLLCRLPRPCPTTSAASCAGSLAHVRPPLLPAVQAGNNPLGPPYALLQGSLADMEGVPPAGADGGDQAEGYVKAGCGWCRWRLLVARRQFEERDLSANVAGDG